MAEELCRCKQAAHIMVSADDEDYAGDLFGGGLQLSGMWVLCRQMTAVGGGMQHE